VNPSRLYHTVRHLKPIQIYGRVLHHCRAPHVSRGAPPPLRRSLRPPADAAVHRPSMRGPTEFRFLNASGTLTASSDWNDPAVPKLWLYNLHYFDDLGAEDAVERRAWHRQLIDRWITENPPTRGVGWDPYPTSLRIINWIKSTWRGEPLSSRADHSLGVQARHLQRRMERHLLGNHLFANAQALVFAGLYFEGPEADAFLAQGLETLAQEIPEQILPDGGHFERSPMYHALVLEGMLDLINWMMARGAQDRFVWREQVCRMLRWLETLSHPDGEIVLFNDAAIGIAPPCEALFEYAGRLGISPAADDSGPIRRLGETGYVRVDQGPAVAFLDLAPLGPDYLPAHGHADTLGFELSLRGRRVLVDSGTSVYEPGPDRIRQRGTASHNTVRIDGEDSSEVWGSFRVARRARVSEVSASTEGSVSLVQGAHDGYTRRHGRGLHHRCWELRADRMTIRDRIEGRGVHEIEVAFHLHPEIEPCGHQGREIELRHRDGGVVGHLALDEDLELAIEPSTYHPEFGLGLPSHKIVGYRRGPLPCTLSCTLRWS